MITSVNNATIKELNKLKQKKNRKEYYLVEGDHLVNQALELGLVDTLISTVERDDALVVSEEVMKKLAFTKTPQNIMAKVKRNDVKELVDGSYYLILDGLQDPGNIGTLIRTASAFGIDQVILSSDSVDLYNDKLLRSMQGAHYTMPIIMGDLREIIPELKGKDVKVIGSALENGKPIKCIDKGSKMAVVLGNEGNGMHKDILALCDAIAYIPIVTMESLNVAVAGSIMMYEFHNELK